MNQLIVALTGGGGQWELRLKDLVAVLLMLICSLTD